MLSRKENMNKLLQLTAEPFESASYRTPQYLTWHRTLKREFKKFLESLKCTDIQISKPNHFDGSGFFRAPSGQIFYFSVSDLRWAKNNMLVRTAKGFSDYTGGHNQYASLAFPTVFESEFKRIIGL
jgi:hypothetical protein